MRRREFLTGSDRAGHAVGFPRVSTARQSRERLRIIGTGRRADADRGLRRSHLKRDHPVAGAVDHAGQ
jgi:hypothetical protein